MNPIPPTLRRIAAALGLGLLILGSAAIAAADDRFDEAKAAFASAANSRDDMHAGYVKAFTIWTELAEAGDTRALYHLGIMSIYGVGGAEFDQIAGIQSVRESAEGGYAVAQSYLGFLAEFGDGSLTTRGPEIALSWWRKGAAGNHCTAVRRMARAYANGELGLETDPDKAAEWKAREATCFKN